MPRLTALRRARPGSVLLEVDGEPWRRVPDDVVVRAGLAAGMELDRPTLRRIRAELARARAVGVAARTVARREASARELEGRLARADVGPATAAEVVASLERVGVVDDARFAGRRAAALADRGYGDAAIAARLGEAGVPDGLVRETLADLVSESERARALLDAEADRAKRVRFLARRGFSPDTIEAVLGPTLDWDGSPELDG